MFAPFRGLLFDPAVVDTGPATSPPYDVIDAEDRAELLASSPFNMVRLLLAEPDDEFDGVLRLDARPRLYLYEMIYDLGGATRGARGVLGAPDVLPLGERVLPHEETMPKTRADRLNQLSALQANADVIIALTAADIGAMLEACTGGDPRLDFTAGGMRHRLYDVTDTGHIDAICRAVAGEPVAIADGHHRYLTATSYVAQRHKTDGPGPWDAILAFVAPASGSGLHIEAVHRWFDHGSVDLDELRGRFEIMPSHGQPPDEPGTLVVSAGSSAHTLVARAELLDRLPKPMRVASAAVARDILYPAMDLSEAEAHYAPDPDEARRAADAAGGVAVLTAPVDEDTVAQAARANLRFPQKTTYFAPKPRAGLVIRSLER
jgi:uncharacterized protein (DUF1015 family)